MRLFFGMLIILGYGTYADASPVRYNAICSVLEQPRAGEPARLLARKEVSIEVGQVAVIHQERNLIYQAVLETASEGTPLKTHYVFAYITYGGPNYLAAGAASFTEAARKAGFMSGVIVKSSGLPLLECHPQ